MTAIPPRVLHYYKSTFLSSHGIKFNVDEQERKKNMIIEDYKRIDGWLNIRMNPTGNQSLYDFTEYVDGVHHTLTEAHDLYNQYMSIYSDQG